LNQFKLIPGENTDATVHFELNLASPKSAGLADHMAKQGKGLQGVVVAALAKSGHRRLRAGRGAALEQDGDMENPFWGLGWGGAHQRWLPMVACFGRRWTLGRGRRSGEDGSLNGRRGAPRCGDARGGGGKTRR
jgi:hypothetical protein